MSDDKQILEAEFKIVLVIWQDTEGHSGWHDELELKDYVVKPCLTMKSAGWLIHNCFTHVVLAMSCGENHSGDLLKIPWAMITDMRTVPDDSGEIYRYPSPAYLLAEKAKVFNL